MSEANVPHGYDSSDEQDALARANQMPVQRSFLKSINDDGDWEAVSLPGMMPPEAIPEAPEIDAFAASPSAKSPANSREAELLTLIQDLNRCNEVLLARVNQLEGALESSQQALNQEVERSQHLSQEEKTAAAQQQSVAQLLSELEETEASLKRQTILAETLQAQIESHQDGSNQLEDEYALLQKQHAKKSQMLAVSEESCRDLRSRLQRQQRYTLQFKAALEKCLETPAFNKISAGIHNDADVEIPPLALETSPSSSPAAMPRAASIRPWSATEASDQTDPQLLSLVRSLADPNQIESSVETASTIADEPVTPELTIDSDAEKQLWQDVERVIESSASPSSEIKEPAQTSKSGPDPNETQFTEPMPWGAPIAKEPVATAEAVLSEASLKTEPTVKSSDNISPAPKTALQVPPVANHSSSVPEIPAIDAANTPQPPPSPVVHPLRPHQKKRKSLAAVELPSFPPLPKKKE